MSESVSDNAPRKLPLRRILFGAFALPWENRIAVMRAVGLPMLFLVSVFLAWVSGALGQSPFLAWLAWGVNVLAIAWLAITVHRLVLANAWEPRPAFADLKLKRFAYFASSLIFVWLLYEIVTMFVMLALSILVNANRLGYVPAGETLPPPSDPAWIRVVAPVVAYWMIGRISLMLPAVAVDGKPDLIAAWRCSSGNATKMAVVAGALPWILDQVTTALWRDGATTFEVAFLAVLIGVFAIIGFVALSLSYYELTRASAPPPTHPPV